MVKEYINDSVNNIIIFVDTYLELELSEFDIDI